MASVDADGKGSALQLFVRSDSPVAHQLDALWSEAGHQLTTGMENPMEEMISESDIENEMTITDRERNQNRSIPPNVVSGFDVEEADCKGINPDFELRIPNPDGSNLNLNYEPEAGSEDKSTEIPEEPSATPKMDFDELLTLTGEFGRFQAIVFVVLSVGILIEVMLVLGYVFVAATPSHWCTAPAELDHLNLTHEDLLRLTLPVDDSTETGYSQCQMYKRNYTGWSVDDVNRWLNMSSEVSENWTTTTCQWGWDYDKSVYSSTIVSDWDLVCDDSWMASFAYTVIGLGQLIGATFWGTLSDRFGRRRPYYVAMTLMISAAVFVSLSPNFVVYCVLQFIVAVNTVACFATGVTIAVELSGVTWRGHLATAINYFWTLGYMLLAVIAYGIRDWTYLQLTISLPFVLFLLTAVFVPESPRWLYSRGRSEQADKIFKRMVNFNGQNIPDNLDVYVEGSADDTENGVSIGSCLNLCRNNRMRVNTIVLGFIWFGNALVYYGISIFMPTMAGNAYLNFFLSGAVEIPGYAVAQLSIAYLGRRWPLCVTLIIAGIALISTMVIPEDLSWLSITLTMIGKLCVTASWSIAICFTAELYPTVIRAKGMFTSTLCGNVGNTLAPMVGLLSTFSAYIPLGTFGVVAIVAGLASLIPPETKGKHLLDSIPSAKDESTSDSAIHWTDGATKTSFRQKNSYEMEQPTSGKYNKCDVD